MYAPHYQFIKLVFVPQEPAVAFAKKGYHILLEKPMAVSVLSINMNHFNEVHNFNLIMHVNNDFYSNTLLFSL